MRALLLALALSGCAAEPGRAFDGTSPVNESSALRRSAPLYEMQGIDWQPELAVAYDADGSPRFVEVKK